MGTVLCVICSVGTRRVCPQVRDSAHSALHTAHEFTYRAASPARAVFVAGTFNNWSTSATPMNLGPDGRTWSVKLELPLGRIQYKFVVNGTDWTLDPSSASESDGNGHTNSVFDIAPADYDRPASPKDGVIARSALRHVMAVPDLNYDRGRLRFRFRARPNDLAAVYLRIHRAPSTEHSTRLSMEPLSADNLFQTYEASIPWDRKTDLDYDFEIHDSPVVAIFDASGLHDAQMERGAQPFALGAKGFHPFEVPSWPERSVIYQIFPDRFARGGAHDASQLLQPWGAKPTYSNFFGGNIAGVRQRLGYLSDLGVRAVYFNPIFSSPSNHRYETSDYLKVDSRFGTNQEFDSLTRAMHARGIRTILDFALNHTATNFFAFKDVIQKGPQSQYANWYWIKSYPVVVKENPPYTAWFNYPSMPKLNVMNPAAHRYVLDAVGYWIRQAQIDGVRLDVANEVDPQLWRDLRVQLKESGDKWIVGEEWGDATPWLSGDQWDSTMGYQFRDASLAFFAEGKTTPSGFLARLLQIYNSYPPQVARNLMNLLDSHDTPRFLTLCHGDRDELLLAATVEFTWPGAPALYYGDELGMEGGVDPDNRRCMDWSTANVGNAVLAAYKRLIKVRNALPSLQSGDPAVLSADDKTGTFAYSRTLGSDCAIVAVNSARQARQVSLAIPSSLASAARRVGLLDAITGRRVAVAGPIASFTLPGLRAAVLVPADRRNLSSFSPSNVVAGRAFKRSGSKAMSGALASGQRSPSHSQGAY